MINATATSMYGTILTSPAGFYVIPTVKVIRVPAVTQANGQLACTTTSMWSLLCGNFGGTASPYSSTVRTTAVFTGMNDQMQAYYSGQQGPSVVTMGTYQETLSRAPTNTTGYPSTTVISFSTPYLYFPPEAATEAEFFDYNNMIFPASIPGAVTTSSTPSPTTTISLTSTVTYTYSSPAPIDTVNDNYGFIPSGIIPWMLQNPDYANQYPGLESCLAGGPTITPNTGCVSVAPATAEVVPDLTASAATTVKGLGCFHPGNCPAAAATTKAPEPAVSAAAVQASSTAPPRNASPGTSLTVAALPEHSQGQSKPSTVKPMSVIAPIPVAPTTDAHSPAPPQPKQPPPSQQTQQSEYRTSNTDSGTGLNPQTGTNVNVAGQKTPPTSTPLVMPIQPAPSVQSTSPAQNLQSASSLPIIIIASSTIAVDSSSNFVFGSHTMIPGGSPTVISSSTFSLAPSASALIVNGATSTIPPPPSSPSPSLASPPNLASIIAGAFTGHPAITALSQTISADSSSQFIIGSQTLAPGSSPLTISGSTFSLAPSASAIIVNGITSAIFVTPNPIAPVLQQPTNLVLTLPSSSLLTATPTSAPVYIFNSQTLTAGGSPITINSTPISLPPSGSALVVGTQTHTLAPGSAPVLTLGSQTLTASTASAQAYIVAGQTLLPGGAAATVNGVEVSIAPSGTAAVVGGVTQGFAAPSGNASAYAGPGFTGGASEGRGRGWGWVMGLGLGVLGVVMW